MNESAVKLVRPGVLCSNDTRISISFYLVIDAVQFYRTEFDKKSFKDPEGDIYSRNCIVIYAYFPTHGKNCDVNICKWDSVNLANCGEIIANG